MSEAPQDRDEDLISQFQADVHLRIDRWRSEYDMVLPDIIATLGLVISDLCQELEVLNELEQKEDDDSGPDFL